MIYSPLEQFEVFELIGIHTFFGYTFALTNLGLYSVLVLCAVISMHLASNNDTLIPTRWITGLETLITTVNTMTKEQIGNTKEIYLPFIYGIFLFILLGNLFGNIPYNFAISSSAIFCLGLSTAIFLGNTILAIYKHGWHFITFFLPAGTPTVLIPLLFVIELISYTSRALSLGIRLFANIVAGHALLVILSGIIYKIIISGFIFTILSIVPLTIFIALVFLEILVSFIQAYVWCTLVCSYLHDAEYLH